MTVRVIPVFPLPLVLFPGMSLPLHIFEDRYKQMMADVQAHDGCFGIALVEPDPHCPGSGKLHAVGSLARLTELTPLADGRYNLICEGLTRFRVVEWLEGAPYATARVELLCDGEGDPDVASAVRDRFTAYVATVQALVDLPLPSLPSGISSTALSYGLAATMQLDLADKQSLLDAASTTDRLNHLLGFMDREIARLDALAACAQRSGPPFFGGIGFSLN